jgi:pimeloyl-ACP methyl ester carboxylesterase
MELRRVELDEVMLEITEAGEGPRKLLMLHGFTGAKDDFTHHEAWVDRLAEQGWHVVAPDQRGHGASDAPSDESAYSFDIYAEDARRLVDALGWDRFALLGHSMGGMIAQVLAAKVAPRLTGLVLMDTSHCAVDLSTDELDAALLIVRTEGMETLDQVLNERGSPLQTPAARRLDETRPGWVEFGTRKFLACSPAMYCAMAQSMFTVADRIDSLASLDVPTLVIVGEQDAPFVAPSERMAKTIPGARLAVIPDAGHSPQFEAPQAWWDALTGFLDTLPAVR